MLPKSVVHTKRVSIQDMPLDLLWELIWGKYRHDMRAEFRERMKQVYYERLAVEGV